MARRIDPHLNERSDRFKNELAEAFEVPDEVVTLLPSNLHKPKRQQVIADIKWAFGEYQWELEDGPNRYARSEEAEALRQLLKLKCLDYASVEALNDRAYDDLYLLGSQKLQNWMLTPAEGPAPIEDINASATRVLKMLRQWRGPDGSVALHMLVRRLCEIYEEMSGRATTLHNRDEQRIYTEEPQTDAGRFVAGAIRAVHPEIRNSAISEQMKGYIKQRRGDAEMGTNSPDT